MVYLCCRKLLRDKENGPRICSMLGRETALDPIRWTEDGWPIVNELKGPGVLQRKPDLPPYTAKEQPDKQWMSPREPEPDGIRIEGNRFVLRGSRSPLDSIHARNLCLRRQTAFHFLASVKLLLPKLLSKSLSGFFPGQEAGLTCYYDENSWVCFFLGRDEKGLFLQVKEHIGTEMRCHEKEYMDQKNMDPAYIDEEYLNGNVSENMSIKLGVQAEGLKRQFFARIGDMSYKSEVLEDVYYLCDEGISMGKRFTGAMVGMYAFAGEKPLYAEFEDFRYEAFYEQNVEYHFKTR